MSEQGLHANIDSVSDREKWQAEREFKSRELDIRERELEVKLAEQRQALWRGPLIIAFVAAVVAAAGNAVVAYTNGQLERALEAQKSEQVRILEMIKTGDPDKATANLRFLLKAGLIVDKTIRESLKDYLSQVRETDQTVGPTLPPAAGAIDPSIKMMKDRIEELMNSRENLRRGDEGLEEDSGRRGRRASTQ